MNKIFTFLLHVCLWSVAMPAHAGDTQAAQIDFVENRHQFPQEVLYKASLPGGAVFLTGKGFTYTYYSTADLDRIHDLKHDNANVNDEPVHCHAYKVNFAGADEAAVSIAGGKRGHHHNYFLGNDPSRWAGGVPLFEQVTRSNIYKGIDAVMYSKGSALKYDFVVHPGADATVIQLQFEGVTPQLQKNGNLELKTSVNTVIEQAPYAYQVIGGKR